MKKTENKKNEMLRRNGPVIKSVESVLGPKGYERFVKVVGFTHYLLTYLLTYLVLTLAGSKGMTELWMVKVMVSYFLGNQSSNVQRSLNTYITRGYVYQTNGTQATERPKMPFLSLVTLTFDF